MINENNYLILKQYLCMIEADRLNRIVIVNNKEVIPEELINKCNRLLETMKVDRVHPTQTFMEDRSIVRLDEFSIKIKEWLARIDEGSRISIDKNFIFEYPKCDELINEYVKENSFQTNIRHSLATIFDIFDKIYHEIYCYINNTPNLGLNCLILKINLAQGIETILDISEQGEAYWASKNNPMPLISEV